VFKVLGQRVCLRSDHVIGLYRHGGKKCRGSEKMEKLFLYLA